MASVKIFTAMKTIQQEEYTKLNRALHELEQILSCMGVTEFTLTKDKHNMKIDPSNDNIDTELLDTFCNNIDKLHHAKFGSGIAA